MPAGAVATCPQCRRSPEAGKWVCRCGAVLNLDVLRHEKPADRMPSILDLTAGPVTGVSPAGELTPTDELNTNEQPTLRFDPVQGLSEMFMGRVAPIPNAEVDVFSLDLSPMDLYVYSKIDGSLGTAELSDVTGLKQVELGVVLLALMRASAVGVISRVSIETVGGNGAQWSEEKSNQVKRAAVDSARRQFEKFRERRESGDVNGATLHLKRAIASVQDEAYIDKLKEHLATTAKWCDEVYSEARTMLSQGHPEAALARLEKGVARFPAEAGFYNLMAIAIVAQDNDYDRARIYLNRATELDPENPVYAQNLDKLNMAHPTATEAACSSASDPDIPTPGILHRIKRAFSESPK